MRQFIGDGGTVFNIISMLDSTQEETDDPSLARTLILQLPEDQRPQGIQQKYYFQEVSSLELALLQ